MSHKRDSLVPIGKASSGLSVKAICSTSPQARRGFTRSDQVVVLQLWPTAAGNLKRS